MGRLGSVLGGGEELYFNSTRVARKCGEGLCKIRAIRGTVVYV